MNRRDMLRLSAAGLAAGVTPLPGQQQAPAAATLQAPGSTGSSPPVMSLEEYLPKSMLHVKATHVERAKYPFLDWHTHITHGTGLKPGDGIGWATTPEECLKVMDAVNLRTMVDLTGGYGPGNKEAIDKLAKPHPGRFIVFTEPAYNLYGTPNFAKKQADFIQQAHANGAQGLKVLKTLGLFLKENVTTGPYVKVDDPALIPCGTPAANSTCP